MQICKRVSKIVINMYQQTSIAPTPPWTMGYAQETQHSQLTQRIQVFIKSLKFADEVLLEITISISFPPEVTFRGQ